MTNDRLDAAWDALLTGGSPPESLSGDDVAAIRWFQAFADPPVPRSARDRSRQTMRRWIGQPASRPMKEENMDRSVASASELPQQLNRRGTPHPMGAPKTASRHGSLSISVLLVVILIVASLGTARLIDRRQGPAVPSITRAIPAASPFVCPVTQPNGVDPGPTAFGRGNGDFGNDALWTSLWIWGQGVVRVPADQVGPDGLLGSGGGLKWSWYRFIPGTLTIEGRRIDAPAPPLISTVPAGYGDDGFQVSGVAFPTGGCWQITGHVAGKSLTFVVLVIPPPGMATPVATPT